MEGDCKMRIFVSKMTNQKDSKMAGQLNIDEALLANEVFCCGESLRIAKD